MLGLGMNHLSALQAMTAAKQIVPEAQRVSGGYLIALYFIYTCAELCISPVGLSSMSMKVCRSAQWARPASVSA